MNRKRRRERTRPSEEEFYEDDLPREESRHRPERTERTERSERARRSNDDDYEDPDLAESDSIDDEEEELPPEPEEEELERPRRRRFRPLFRRRSPREPSGADETRRPKQRLPRPTRSRRGRGIAIAVLLGIPLFVYFAPAIVGHTGLCNSLAGWCLPELREQLHIDRAQLGWLSPLSLQDVTIRDGAGKPVVELAELKSERSLAGLLFDSRRAGTVHLRQPRIHLDRNEAGQWNLAEVLAKLLPDEPNSADRYDVRCQIDDGVLTISDQGKLTECRIEKLSGLAQSWQADERDWTASIQGTVIHQERSGTFDIELTAARGADGNDSAAGPINFRLRTERLPLDGVRPDWIGMASTWRWAGKLSAILEGMAQISSTPQTAVKGKLRVDDFLCHAPEIFGEEPLRLANVNINTDAQIVGSNAKFHHGTLESELGQLTITGTLPLRQFPTSNWRDLLSTFLQQEPLRITGTLDLSKLSRLVPAAVRLREGATVESGNTDIQLEYRPDGDAAQWNGRVRTENLVLRNQEKTFHWDEPWIAEIRGTRTGPDWQLRHVQCRAPFLQAEAKIDAQQGNIAADGDLARLMTEVGQVFDLGDLRLAGQLHVKGSYHADAQSPWNANLQGFIERLHIQNGGGVWQEPKIAVTVTAGAAPLQGTWPQWERATCQLRAQDDQLQIDWTPSAAAENSAHGFVCQLQGDAGRWWTRIRPWTTWQQLDCAGQINLQANGRIQYPQLSVENARGEAQHLALRMTDWSISEPLVRFETGRFDWDLERQQGAIPNFTLASTTISLRASDFQRRPGEIPWKLGALAFRSRLERLWDWASFGRSTPLEYRPSGQLTGKLSLLPDGNALAWKTQANVTDLAWSNVAPANAIRPIQGAGHNGGASGMMAPWATGRVELMGEGALLSADRMRVDQLVVRNDVATVSAQGDWTRRAEGHDLDVNGNLEFDWDRITSGAQPWLPMPGFLKIQGQQAGPFHVRGTIPISTATNRSADRVSQLIHELDAGVNLEWTSAQLAGYALQGQGMTAQWKDGTLRTQQPIRLTWSGGNIELQPWIDWTQGDPLLRLAPGRIVDNVQLSPDVCRGWLKYVAPLLADATAAEGRFSLQLDEAQVPATMMEGARMQGRLEIEQARIGAGPLAQRLIQIAQQIKDLSRGGAPSAPILDPQKPWILLPAQPVAWSVAEGKVHHRDLIMMIDNLEIKTSGSVGFDETMSLLADIKVPAGGDNRWLAALQGRPLRVPITGTIRTPKIDSRVIGDLAPQLLRGQAETLLQTEFERQLQRLFPGNKK